MSDEYEVGEVMDAGEVPNWARRQPKWQKLIDSVINLDPNSTLPVVFKNRKAADHARNTIRDAVNLRLGKAIVRTRVVDEIDKATKEPTGRAVVYLTRLREDDIVEEKPKEE